MTEWRRIFRCVALCGLLLLLAACQTELYKGLSEREANVMASLLAHHGITAEREYQDSGQVTLTVDKSQFSDAVDILERAGLPKEKFQNIGDVFKSNGLVSSPDEERARMVYALGQELSHTVSDIDGVLSARVQVVLPRHDLLKKQAKPASASVFIRHNRTFNEDKLVPRIKTLVADSVSGLTYDRVSVVTVAAVTPDPNLPTQSHNASFLGISVAQASLGTLRWLIVTLGLVIAVLASALAWLLWQQRREQTYDLSPAAGDS